MNLQQKCVEHHSAVTSVSVRAGRVICDGQLLSTLSLLLTNITVLDVIIVMPKIK